MEYKLGTIAGCHAQNLGEIATGVLPNDAKTWSKCTVLVTTAIWPLSAQISTIFETTHVSHSAGAYISEKFLCM